MPLAVELFGRWAATTLRLSPLVKKMASDLKGLTGSRYSNFVGYWLRAISVDFQRDVARSALRIYNVALGYGAG